MSSLRREAVSRGCSTLLLLVALTLIAATTALAEEPSAEHVFAVLTHKGGFASGRGHNHLIVAGRPEVKLDLDPENVLATHFGLEVLAVDLLVDPDPLRGELYSRLEELGLLDESFGEVDEKARRKIRTSMLDRDQLDAERFPQIAVKLLEVREETVSFGAVEFPFSGAIELSIHGHTVVRPFHASVERRQDAVFVEAIAEAAFSDFDIKPFSAFLGAVKNLDPVHFYLRWSVAAVP